jgi:hypothetical protein
MILDSVPYPLLRAIRFRPFQSKTNGTYTSRSTSIRSTRPSPSSGLAISTLPQRRSVRNAPTPSLCSLLTYFADLSNAKKKWNKAAGYTASETGAYARILKGPKPEIPASRGDTDGAQPPISGRLVDVWRDRHPTWQHYSYWAFRGQCRHKGIGWRLDMCMLVLQPSRAELLTLMSSCCKRTVGAPRKGLLDPR